MHRLCIALAFAIVMSACQPTGATPMATDTPSQFGGDGISPDLGEQPDGEEPRSSPSDRTACRDELGQASAERLVQRCIMVSPATHPPCNVVNPCAMIQGEIDRACGMYGPQEAKPEECRATTGAGD